MGGKPPPTSITYIRKVGLFGSERRVAVHQVAVVGNARSLLHSFVEGAGSIGDHKPNVPTPSNVGGGLPPIAGFSGVLHVGLLGNERRVASWECAQPVARFR